MAPAKRFPCWRFVGIGPDGQREVLTFTVGERENQGAWEDLLEQLKQRGVRHTLLHLTLPMTSPSALYRQMLMALNQPIPFGTTAQTTTLRAVLADLIQTHRKTPVVVIDEAHLLGQHLIDPLRTLISAQLDSHSLAALILIGQPELRRMLQLSTHAAFAQRITHRCHMEPVIPRDTLMWPSSAR